jgi:hypothetical protein
MPNFTEISVQQWLVAPAEAPRSLIVDQRTIALVVGLRLTEIVPQARKPPPHSHVMFQPPAML